MKRCSKCKQVKDESEFMKYTKSKSKLYPWCRTCVKDYNNEPEVRSRRKKIGKNWHKNNPEKSKLLRARNSLKRSGCSNVDDVELSEFLSFRPKTCEICGRPSIGKALAVDHDHRTGRLRGFLCYSCNRHILAGSDDPAVLRRAADYLESTWQQRLKKPRAS